MNEIPVFFVDAFADKPFTGNPAAVCLLEQDHNLSSEWMQLVAAEINLSETAFVEPASGRLRWFTPGAEVDLCGHATIATAKALLVAGKAEVGECLRFQTRSGELTAEIQSDNRVRLDFPSTPPSPDVAADPVLKKLFPSANQFLKSRFDWLVELPAESDIRAYQPDFSALAECDARGIILTARSDREEVDFVSRFFAPAVGVDEDPVTGSAHCCLAPYWGTKLNVNTMMAEQLSSRGGRVALELSGDRVKLTGGAILTIQGTLFQDAHS